VILYDLTTLRFESTRTDLGELRQFGYSKERRSDCTQVVLGLLVTPEGIPIGFEVSKERYEPGLFFIGQIRVSWDISPCVSSLTIANR